MPRTDSLDPQALHNLQGIDLRKNADQNTALDAVNVMVDSRQLFVNRPMPALYKDRSDKYLFACEARNLASYDFDYDVTFDGSAPSVSYFDTSVPEKLEDDFSFRIVGSGFISVNFLFFASDDSVKLGNTDFSFIYNKEEIDGQETDTILLSIEPPSGSVITIVSPFGTTSLTI